jgi:hypothetical protein
MVGDLHQTHIRKRLKIIHLFGIGAVLCFFILLSFLGKNANLNTETTQYILIFMAILMAISYLTLLLHTSDKIPTGPAVMFVGLNILNSALVWSTGILESPFIIFYAILIIMSSQLYKYRLGLLQAVIALLGFVSVYGATSTRVIPYSNILLYSDISILYQPPSIILVYGSLYAVLFIFAVFASSSARTVLFREHEKTDIDMTYQEKIIQELPIGILIVDWDLNILGTNPASDIHFPIDSLGSSLTEHLSIMRAKPKVELIRMSKTCEEKQLMWKKDDEEVIPVKVSVRLMEGEKKENGTFIIFLDRLTH